MYVTVHTMVICKYYRQGNCRFGQHCTFEHINNFGITKTEHEDDIAVTVAKEILLAERGGQWLLSCFGPFRDRPIIPGMEDLSPEEVRCEMYEAQKSGMVEQAKLHFQQLCQDMKAKREALKNPTRETITMLKKILGCGQKGTHLSLNRTSINNVFGNKTFGVQNNNPFGGGGFISSNNTSIFANNNNNSMAVFGGTATFGNNLGFATATSTNSFFGGTTNTSTSFNSMQNNTSTFGVLQNNSVFGGSSQTVFGQNNNVFGTTSQLNNASSTSLFNSPMTSQANTSLFGGTTTTTPNLFGGSSSSALQTNSVFGTSTTSSGSSFNSGIFNQPKTQMPAFGGAPVFGGVTSNYANNSSGNSIFGVSQTFGASTAISTNSIFGGSTAAATPAFGVSTAMSVFGASLATTTTPTFGTSITTTPSFNLNQQHGNNNFGTTVSAPNVFNGTQNTDANRSSMSVGNNNAPFGTSITAGPFVTVNSQQYDSTNVNSTPFANTGFGIAVASTNNTFGTTETSSNSTFANTGTTFATSNAPIPNSSFPTSTFGNTSSSTNTTLTTTTNPFAPWSQQDGTPFGSVQSSIGPSSPLGKLPFNIMTNTDINDTVYSMEGTLTDDEKSMYLAEKFIIGKIPLKPPTKDIR